MEKAIVEGIIYTRKGSKKFIYNKSIGWFREVIAKGAIERAMARPIRRYLAISHKRMIACDDELEIWETPEGLTFKAYIREPEVIAMIIQKGLNESSFSFVVKEQRVKKKSADVAFLPGKTYSIRTIKELELIEVSLTEGPSAYPSEFKITYIPDSMMLDVYKARLELLRGE